MAEFRLAMREAELEDIIEDLVEAFLQDAPGRITAIESAVQSGDAESIRLAAHAYKSSAATMYAHQLAGLLRLMELAGGEGDADRATSLLPQVKQAHDAIMDQLRGELK
jgi:HPt (histidine-containing phosphotransfer) domain-containing protein